MAYTAYERATGSCMDEVEALCKYLTADAVFSTTTQPTLAEVEEWLTAAYRIINVKLLEYGYAADQTDTDVKGALQHYNALWAAAQVEFSQPSAGFTPEGENRGDKFLKMFDDELQKLINSRGFFLLGATKTEGLLDAVSAGGIRVADKRTLNDDSDFLKTRFRMGQFDDKGTHGSLQETRRDL